MRKYLSKGGPGFWYESPDRIESLSSRILIVSIYVDVFGNKILLEYFIIILKCTIPFPESHTN